MNKYIPSKHILLDFFGAENLTDSVFITRALRDAAEACGATILDIKIHEFGKNSGITGVALLAESHISIHTWPEISYAALDVFLCGKCQPEPAIEILKNLFLPQQYKVTIINRGEEIKDGK